MLHVRFLVVVNGNEIYCANDLGSRFRLLFAMVKPVQTDKAFPALVSCSTAVTCFKVNWLQNNTQIFGSDIAESFSEVLLSVSGKLQLDPTTWNIADVYKCLIDFEQSNSQGETFQIFSLCIYNCMNVNMISIYAQS